MPKVSIVISIYNVKSYLDAAIQSALDQTEEDIEIILVDDGSTDGSGRLCDAYAARDGRIKAIHKENGGLSSARNAGVAAAAGEYVLLLDGDDYLHERAVERLLSVAEQYPSDLIQFRYAEVDGAGPLPELAPMQIEAQGRDAQTAFERLYQFGGVYAAATTKLLRRTLLEDIPFESIRHEDEMWCTRAFPRGLTITYIPDVLYGYVSRPGSIIRSRFSSDRLEILTVLEERLGALNTLGSAELEQEAWNRLFKTLFLLYRDGKHAGDEAALGDILSYAQRSPVLSKAKITGRMRLFYALARVNWKWAFEVYGWYWKRKGGLS